MARDVSKFKNLGPCTVSLGGVDFGHTDKSGVKVTITTPIVDATAGQFGEAPVGSWENGTKVEVEFTLLQTDRANFAALAPALPGATRVEASGVGKITFGHNAGTQQTAFAAVFAPINTSFTTAYKFTIPQAVPMGDPEVVYSGDQVQGWKIKLKALVDESAGADGRWMATFGDPSISADTTPPTVSTVVPADDATGVSTATTITWTFSEDMDQGSLNDANINVIKDIDGTPLTVAGAISFPATNQAVFTPTSALSATTKYSWVLSSGIKDKAGNALVRVAGDFTTT